MTTFLFFGVFFLLSGGGDGNCRRTPVSSLSDTVGSFPAFVRDNFLSEQCLSSRKTGILLSRVVTLSPYVMADLYNPHRQELELTELWRRIEDGKPRELSKNRPEPPADSDRLKEIFSGSAPQ